MIAPTTPRIVLAAGVRTPWARAGGAFAQEDAGHLGALVAREVIARSGIDPGEIDEVIAGCAGPPHDQANVGRVIALRAGVPERVPAKTVARNCASGMEALTSAWTQIRAGQGELYLVVGVEVMSRFPLFFGEKATKLFAELARARTTGERVRVATSFRPAMLKPRIGLMEGLTDPVPGLIMGKTAEILAREWDVSREEADRFALESHQRARRARDEGRFAREIVPVLPLGARGGARSLEHDDSIRDEQTLEALGRLKPYFEKPDGRVTVGNSCGVTDGACALLVATDRRARALGIEPLAEVEGFAWAGLDPARMGLGPVYATSKLLEENDLELVDVDAIELNEAFAVQVLACIRAFESDDFARAHLGREQAVGRVDLRKLNRNGGAIALGHPVGATGARLLLSAAHEVREGSNERVLATLCIGGGQGGAVMLRRYAT